MMTFNYYIGVDPGVNGGICVIDKNHNIIYKTTMPVVGTSKKEYDVFFIYKILSYYSNAIVFIEKAQPFYRDGKKQSFKTGFGYGVLQGVLAASNTSFQIVAPKVWQKTVFEGVQSHDTKKDSLLFCKRKWPNEDWTPTERSKKVHDGMTDAACIAYYGLVRSK